MTKKKQPPQAQGQDLTPEGEFRFIYTGMRLGEGDKRKHVWIEVPADTQNDGSPAKAANEQTWLWEKLTVKGAQPGQMYQIPAKHNEGGGLTMWSGKAQYAGMWANRDDVLRWQMEHRAAEIAVQRRARDAETSPLQQTVDQLGRHYRRMNARNRAAFMAWLIHELEKYA